ncbi:unnamed protein product [Closterium sp. Yama58-4]|nr:unnamed protein product [Closterium sp. Yama58-4]
MTDLKTHIRLPCRAHVEASGEELHSNDCVSSSSSSSPPAGINTRAHSPSRCVSSNPSFSPVTPSSPPSHPPLASPPSHLPLRIPPLASPLARSPPPAAAGDAVHRGAARRPPRDVPRTPPRLPRHRTQRRGGRPPLRLPPPPAQVDPAQVDPAQSEQRQQRQQQRQGRQRRRGLDMRAGHVRALRRALQRQQEQVAADAGVAPVAVLLHLHTVAHAFAAALSPRQVWRLKRHPAVASVRRTRVFHAPATTTAPLWRARPTSASNASASTSSEPRTYDADAASFMGLPGSLWQQAGGQSSAGADVVVGVVGSGIWPEHPAFDASAFSGVPAGWQGACDSTPDFTCSGKIIGARRLYAANQHSTGGPDLSVEYDSAAVGNAVTWADAAQTSGMAPGARVAVYKAVWAGYGFEADVLAEVDRAVADGVHVLCLSVWGFKGSQANYFTDAPFLHGHAAGVVVVMAAGDWGKPNFWLTLGAHIRARVIDNFSPFYLTVGARVSPCMLCSTIL